MPLVSVGWVGVVQANVCLSGRRLRDTTHGVCVWEQAYRELAKKHPSFRERSENTDLIVDITLQPFRSFQPDGIILFR